ncbi:MAG: hypothetical protein LBP59_03225 [Planctomycetaceae bacterium]|nr:hypothetical protein [Planctomycetaceae bacterium]
MKKYIITIIGFVFLICGCSNKPADVPPLFPCKIIVTKNASPVEGVNVVLGSTGNDGSHCAVFGITDSYGAATIKTGRLGWQGTGAPEGEYIITITKEPKLNDTISTEEFQKLDPAKQEIYQIEQQQKYNALQREIPDFMSDVTKSPYRLTVKKEGENVLNIDIENDIQTKQK